MKKILVAVLFSIFTVSIANAATSFETDLSFGITGSAKVTTLQEFLRDQGLYTGPITGNFFTLTKNAVIAFQKAHSVNGTGYFGPLTRQKANVLLKTPANNISVSSLEEQITKLQLELKAMLLAQSAEPAPIPPPPPPPQQPTDSGKEIALTANKTTVFQNNWDSVIITAIYKENGTPKPAAFSFTAPEKTQVINADCEGNSPQCGKANFTYSPKTLGTQSISVTTSGVTKTIDITVVPYVAMNPTATLTATKPSFAQGATGATIGTLTLTGADEPILLQQMTVSTNIPFSSFYLTNCATPETNITPVSFGSLDIITLSKNQLMTDCPIKIKMDTSTPSGSYTFTITAIKTIGQSSGLNRTVEGLPLLLKISLL